MNRKTTKQNQTEMFKTSLLMKIKMQTNKPLTTTKTAHIFIY
jgi:hypothetical protein